MDKDSGSLRKRAKLSRENVPSEEQSSIPTNNAGMGDTSMQCDKVVVKEILELIGSTIKCFSESNRDALADGLKRIELASGTDRDFIGMLESFGSLLGSPYSHFVSDMVYSIVSRILSCKIKCCRQVKVLGFAFLLEHYDPLRIFQDMASVYPVLDTFRVGQKSFRNYVLYRSLCRIYEETFPDSSSTNSYSKILECAESASTCIPFAEFLSRNVEDFLCRNFMIVCSYSFLSKLTTDLLHIRKAEDLKDIDDLAISKIFVVLYDIRLSYHRPSGDGEQPMFPSDISVLVGNEIPTDGPKVLGTTENRSAVSCDASGANRKSMAPEKHIASGGEAMLSTLFGSDSISSIILSVYKRLFNYFLFKNRRILASTKVPRIFTKKEKNTIFKHLKSCVQSFVNVFRQIDQSYILRLQSKLCAHDASFPILLQSVKEGRLGRSELQKFYSLYIDFLEYAKRPIRIQIRDIEVFSVAFNSRIDKSFSKFITFRHPITELSSRDVVQMLAYYTGLCNKPVHSSLAGDGIVDIVEAVSLVVDYPQKLLLKPNIQYYNNILCILVHMSSGFSPGLVCRIVPVLRQLIFCRDYALNSGRLYQKLHGQFKFRDGFLTADALSTHKFILMAKGSTNHPTFESSFESMIDSTYLGRHASGHMEKHSPTDPLTEGIVDNALVFYSYYSPLFGLKHQDILQRILQKKNRSTLYFLEYLREYLANSVTHSLGESMGSAANSTAECEELFTFVSNNVKHLYDLYNNDILICRNDGPQYPSGAYVSTGVNPFIDVVLGIFLDSLRIKAILPHMVIPYLMPRVDCGYLYRNHINSCVNCINDALHLVASRIRALVMCCGTANGVLRNGWAGSLNGDQSCPTPGDKGGYDVSESSLDELFERELSVMFLHSIYKHSSLEKVLDKIGHQDDLLVVFIILRNLRPFSKRDREAFIRHVEENVSDEKVFDLLGKSKDFYRKNSRGALPVCFIV